MAQANLIISETRTWVFLMALLCGLYPATGNSSMQDIKVAIPAEISAFLDSQNKTVLTFSGYSGSG